MTRGKNKRISVLAMLASVSLLLTGCWDRLEINDIAIVMAVAVDKEENGNFRVSIEVPLASQLGGAKGGGGGTGGSKAYYIDSETGPTFVQAYTKLQDRMSRRLKFGHYRVIIIGDEAAKHGVGGIFDVITRKPENRLTSYMIVAEGTGEELMKAQPKLERFSGEAIREIVKQGDLISSNVKDTALSMSHLGSDPVLPFMAVKKLKEKGNKESQEIEWLGYAQFHGEKMVDVMRRQAAVGLSWLKNNIKPGTVIANLEHSEDLIFNVLRSQTTVTPSLNQDRVEFDVNIDTRITLSENRTKEDLTNRQVLAKARKMAADQIRAQVDEAIKKIQNTGADSADFGLKVFRQNPRAWKAIENEWSEMLKKAEFRVHIKVDITEFGLISENIVRG